MGRKIAFLVALVVLCILGGTAVTYLVFPPQESQNPVTMTSAVKVTMPIDLSGKWESVEGKTGSKFIANIENNTIHVEMTVSDGFSGLWYGTFDILQPGENSISSKALNDPNKFVLSSLETKDFLYRDGSLFFNLSVMGTTSAVELKRG